MTIREEALKPAPPPVEPKIAYPEPQLDVERVLALICGTTFFAADSRGNLLPPGAPRVGLFRHDTRYLSELQLRFFGEDLVVLSCSTAESNNAKIEYMVRGGAFPGEGLDLPVNTIYVHREQVLGDEVLHDFVEIHSYHDQRLKVSVELNFDADFMDIFQVRGLVRGKSGEYYEPVVEQSAVSFLYDGLDGVRRCTKIEFDPPPQQLQGRTARWEIVLDPRGTRQVRTTISMIEGPSNGALPRARRSRTPARLEHVRERAAIVESKWVEACTRIKTDNGILNEMLDSAKEDFYALQMPESAGTAIAAGVPWFAALFGRDSLIASFETLLLNPDLARGTLCVLAEHQGRERNDERDEDPGKILHELRNGEMTATSEIAFGKNYGSVDSTPLFLILLAEYLRWTGDTAFIGDMAHAIEAAARWVLDYGDLDGDGLVEYCRRNPNGLFNQGWKDSGDAMRHADGRIAQPPTAVIEVQGYAARALASIAPILSTLGRDEMAARAASHSEKLLEIIERKYWLPERNYYAMALDREKKPLAVDSSNPGHLLFSRAISKQRASQVATKLMADGLFSGWGVRTLSCHEAIFNPMSYHCGSVWPHDNAMSCYGMAQYGFRMEAASLFQAMYEATLHFNEYRPPELFCGIRRHGKGEPVHYPVSCSPQAWASGSFFLMLRGLLGIEPDAANHQLNIVHPHLPPFVRTLRMENLRIGRSLVALDFERQGERTFCNVVSVQGNDLGVNVVFKR
ncbi:MAG TPA: glycogen debranching N-terminal domain-containing protein [Acidobacteriaceae bacterium]|nr:glycogen debranching N-terminal domain-containing protein [Acidobacteriaceae bacterium]